MLPLFLKCKNFKCFGEFELDFSKLEIAVITGLNGSGKSAFLDIFEYVLFGKSACNLEKIIRNGTNVCEIEFIIQIERDIYKITRRRYRKGNRAEVILEKKNDNEWIDLSQQRNSEADILIPEILGFHHKTFKTLVLFSQRENERENLTISTKRDGSDRRELFKDAFSLGIYSKLSKFAQDNFLKKDKSSSDELLNKIKNLNFKSSELDDLKNQIKQFEEKLIINNKLKENITALLSEVKINLSQISNNSKFQLENKSFELSEKQKILSLIVEDIEKVCKTSVSKIEKANAIKAKNILLISEISIISDQIVKLTAEIENIDCNLQLKNIQQIEIDLKTQIECLKQDLHRCKIPLSDGQICLYCRQNITIDRKKCLEEIKIKENEVLSSIKKLEKDLQDLFHNKKILENNKENKIKKENEISKLQNKLQNGNLTIDNNKKLLLDIEQEYQLLKNDFESKKDKKQKIELDIENIKLEISKFSNENLLKKELELNLLIDQYQKELNLLDIDISNLNQQIGSIQEKILIEETKKIDFNLLNNDLQKIQKQIRIKELIVKSFNEIPSLIINLFLNELQTNFKQEFAQFLPDLEPEFIIEQPKQGSEPTWKDIIYKQNGIQIELSVGQEFKSSLPMREAFIKLINNRLQHSIKFRLFDEVDAYMDQPGREIFSQMLKKLQKDNKILLISHNEYIQNQFKTRINISNSPNGNTLELC